MVNVLSLLKSIFIKLLLFDFIVVFSDYWDISKYFKWIIFLSYRFNYCFSSQAPTQTAQCTTFSRFSINLREKKKKKNQRMNGNESFFEILFFALYRRVLSLHRRHPRYLCFTYKQQNLYSLVLQTIQIYLRLRISTNLKNSFVKLSDDAQSSRWVVDILAKWENTHRSWFF